MYLLLCSFVSFQTGSSASILHFHVHHLCDSQRSDGNCCVLFGQYFDGNDMLYMPNLEQSLRDLPYHFNNLPSHHNGPGDD